MLGRNLEVQEKTKEVLGYYNHIFLQKCLKTNKLNQIKEC